MGLGLRSVRYSVGARMRGGEGLGKRTLIIQPKKYLNN